MMQAREKRGVAVVGGGPAGLAAAERLSETGHTVTVYEAMPTIGRKFLLAGKSGLNLTHSEDYARFVGRFGAATPRLMPALDAFTPDDLRAWALGLGSETFVGSSGRVFPMEMKASPLLRAWRRRLEDRGVAIRTRHRWLGLDGDALRLRFETPEGIVEERAEAVLLALGGASWPRLGSDGRWVAGLAAAQVSIAPFQPANCGFDVAWSEIFRERFAGAPVKSVVARSRMGSSQGEFVISRHGIEGSLVYGHAAALRDQLAEEGRAALILDLAPGRPVERLTQALEGQPARVSLSNRLRKAAGLDPVKIALVRDCAPETLTGDVARLAETLKALPIPLQRTRPIEEAISSAGGVRFEGLDAQFMLRDIPGLFLAGEMLDWEAPTGGYLLTACMATGRAAADGLASWLAARPPAVDD